jgi:RPA family protein
MSTSASNSGSSSRTDRQPAKRAFAEEFQDASEIFQDGNDERSPKFAVLPTGANANRVFAMGTLTEAADIGSDSEYWQARVVDPTGAFFVYAGQYQPDAMAALREMEAPEYVAVVGKPRTWETDDGEVRTSLTPESITVVEQGTRDQWVVETAEQTLGRIAAMEDVQMGAEASDAIERAQDAYPEASMVEYDQEVKEALAQVAGVELENDDAEDTE